MKPFRFAPAIALLVLVAPTSQAQVDSSLLSQRARVRISDVYRQADLLPKVLELRGVVTSVTPESLTLRLPDVGSSVALPRTSIVSVAVSRGVPSRLESAVRRGVYWGLMGAVLGYTYLESPARDRGHTWEDAIGTAASVGALTGVVVGTFSPYERWRRINVR